MGYMVGMVTQKHENIMFDNTIMCKRMLLKQHTYKCEQFQVCLQIENDNIEKEVGLNVNDVIIYFS